MTQIVRWYSINKILYLHVRGTMEHRSQLESCCRVCGNTLQPSKSKSCGAYCDLLGEAYGLDCAADLEQVHPPHFCCSCYQRARRLSQAKKSGTPYTSSLSPFVWSPHSSDSCCICDFFASTSCGGRKRKETKMRGRPAQGSKYTCHRAARELGVVSFGATGPLTPSRFCTPPALSLVEVQCPLCGNVLDGPVQLTCGKLVCSHCLCIWAEQRKSECPGCQQQHDVSPESLQAPPELVTTIIGGLRLRCHVGCGQYVALKDLQAHAAGNCGHPPLQDILLQPPSTPTTALEQQLASNIVQRMLAESPEEKIVELPTGRQVKQSAIVKKYYSITCTSSFLSHSIL